MAIARPSRSARVEFKFEKARLTLRTQWSEKNHELSDIDIRWEGEANASLTESISRAADFAHGLQAREIFQIDWRQLFPLELFPVFPWLLRQSYQKALNPVPALNQLSGQDSKELLCRCFGIYKQELQSLILKDPSLSAQDLSAQTKAGLGCTTCAQDLQDFLFKTREYFELTEKPLGRRDKEGLWVRPMGMTPAQAVLKLAPLLDEWCRENQVQAEMIDLCGHQVKLRGELSKQQLKELQRHWESHLGIRFAASLFL